MIRPLCADCGEPVELTDADDSDSWIHSIDANYWGDHTAWVQSGTDLEVASKNPAVDRKPASNDGIDRQ
jgi:hypothetical protein